MQVIFQGSLSLSNSKTESQDYKYGLGSGLIYAVNERTQLDGSVGVDLEGRDRSYKAGLGVAFLF